MGAHKTATTRLQACLELLRAPLSARNIEYLNVTSSRNLFDPDLRRAGNGKISVADAISAIRQRGASAVPWDCDIILSYENALGGLRDVLSPGPVGYAQAPSRLRVIEGVFAEWDIKIFYGVREFGSFFSSAYSETARSHETRLPEEVSSALAADHMSWSNLLERLTKVHRGGEIQVFRHEDYRKHEREILQLVSGLPAELIADLPSDDYHGSLSMLAARAIVKARPFTNPKRYREKVAFSKALEAAFPVTPDNPKVNLWTPEQRSRLEVKYQEDLNRLEAMPGVNLLTF